MASAKNTKAAAFDPAHPAIDDNPRKDASRTQNQIDMNDPGLSMEEAVQKNLEGQGSDIASGKPADEKA